MRVRSVVVLVAVGALVLAACGSGSSKGHSDKSTSSTTASRPSTSQTSSPSTLLDAQRRAQASLLVASDFPQGWTSTPYVDTPSNPADSQQLADCLGVPNDDSNGGNDVHGADFALGRKFQVSDSASVIKSEAEATRVLDAINGPKFVPCFQPFVTNQIRTTLAKSAPTANVGNVTVSRLDLPHYGDATAGIDVSVPLSGPGGQTSVTLDLVLIRSGLVGFEADFTGVGQPFDAALRQHLLANATGRLTGKAPAVATSSV